jgi:hypothetical protein
MTNNFAKKVINLKTSIEYQENSIVSKTITTNTNSSLTLFAFDKGNQSLRTLHLLMQLFKPLMGKWK